MEHFSLLSNTVEIVINEVNPNDVNVNILENVINWFVDKVHCLVYMLD